MQHSRVDMAIFGGGIAGLWLLARLRNAGYSAVLFETKALGGVQTIASQGIIHGGAKYALSGNLSDSAKAIGDMPRIWRDCLAGDGELNLRSVRLLSDHQYLWSTENIVSRVAGFFASKAMRSRMTPVRDGERPPIFQSGAFSGRLYRLEEPVVDTASLIAALEEQYGEHCYRIAGESIGLTPGEAGALSTLVIDGEIELQVQRLILAAGAGNERLLARLGRPGPGMQRRPLHMVMARGGLPDLYAHCLGSGTTPRITITSYPAPEQDETVWYIGGQLAESGVRRGEPEQIAAAQQELRELLPWVDLSAVQWAALRVDRAEHKSPGGRRPDSCYVQSEGGIITVWPTKLAFAPRLAQELLSLIGKEGVNPLDVEAAPLHVLERPPLVRYPWEEVACWS
jgi:glycerol-3-phosphate dehydrogenase